MALTDISELTEGKIGGNGTFDKLMSAGRVYLEEEWKAGRLRGPEYSEVMLGMIQSSMNTGLTFMVQGAKLDLERELLAVQVELTKTQARIAEIQLLKTQAELEMLEMQKPKIMAEVKLIEAQVIAMEAENTLIPKKSALMDAEVLHKQKQGELITAQAANAVIEGTVLVAQECKLRAEFDVLMNQMTKTSSEIALLTQKTLTEKAQIQSIGVDPDSVVGRQKTLYAAQTDGFKRDAEQKAAKIMIDTWNARRVSDPGTVADITNKLNDPMIGRFVEKLATGVGA